MGIDSQDTTHCNTLQHSATQYCTLQHTANTAILVSTVRISTPGPHVSVSLVYHIECDTQGSHMKHILVSNAVTGRPHI